MTTPSVNTPDDEGGDGPVTVGDRVGEGSPGSNQSKTEPMPPSGAHSEPLAPPDLGDMNVGAGDPQAPSHPALTAAAVPASAGTTERPSQDAAGTAHRAPGLQGRTPDGESVETDVAAGAARMAADGAATETPGQGDDQGVPSVGTSPSPGTSQEHDVVEGARTPEG